MNKYSFSSRLLLLILGLSLTFCGCVSQKSNFEKATSTFEPDLFISTNPPEKTITHTPTKENTSTPTLFPSRTPTITQIPSYTPLPILSQGKAKQKLYDLLRDNGGCYLPCWWGITPGVTSWNEAYQYLQSLTVRIPEPDTKCEFYNGNKICISNVRFNFGFTGLFGGWGEIGTENQNIILIFLNPDITQHIFQLHQILKDYGKPDQVYIRTNSFQWDNYHPFILVLLYSNKHFMVSFEFDVKDYSGIIFACPRGVAPWIHIWSSDQTVSEEDIEFWALGPDPSIKLQTLESVTDLTIDSFYQTFLDQNQLICIQTPIDIW